MSFGKFSLEGINKYLKTCGGFDKVLSKVSVVEIGNGNCLAELKIDEDHVNPFGGLHGGLSSTLVDSVSTYGLMTHPKVGPLVTVSVDLHLSFLKGAAKNETVKINAKTVKTGKTLAFCDVEILDQNGEVLVKGTHTKFIMRPK